MESVEKNNLFRYTFYDDSHNLCVVLNTDYLKEIFNASTILLDETEHK